MKRIASYFLIMAVLASILFFVYYRAGRFSNTYAELNQTMDLRSKTTQRLDSGQWYINKWAMYHTLTFETPNTLVIQNAVDTVFRYTYYLQNNTLWLVTERDSIANPIYLHNNEELIFETFLSVEKRMRYSRKNLSSL